MGIVVTTAKMLCTNNSGNNHECIRPGFSNAMAYLRHCLIGKFLNLRFRALLFLL